MQIISRALNHEPCKDGWNREVHRVFWLYRPQHIKHFKNPQTNHEVLPKITCLKTAYQVLPNGVWKKGHPIAPACWGVNLCILPKDWINSLHCKIAKHFLDGFNPSEKYQSDIVRFDHHFSIHGNRKNVSSHQSWQLEHGLNIFPANQTFAHSQNVGIFKKQPPLLREDYRYLLSL